MVVWIEEDRGGVKESKVELAQKIVYFLANAILHSINPNRP